MRTRVSGALALILALAACGPVGEKEQSVQSDVRNLGNNNAGSGGAALEEAAMEAGAIPNAPGASPVGLFQRAHEAGSDSLCVVAGEGARYRFGLEVRFGEDESCAGHGEARVADDTLILSFEKSRCVVVASYDGDQVMLPGALDQRCESLCTPRASLAGVELPRTSSEAGAANAVRDRSGDALCSVQ